MSQDSKEGVFSLSTTDILGQIIFGVGAALYIVACSASFLASSP